MKRTSQILAQSVALALVSLGLIDGMANAKSGGDSLTGTNAAGVIATYTASGSIDTNNPFFQSLGTNGRACSTCHGLKQAWTITPTDLQLRFATSNGNDPVFRSNDGANSPNADISSVNARKRAYSMLLNKGVIRVGLGIPANAEFCARGFLVDDPYSYASATELSLFRRPLPGGDQSALHHRRHVGRRRESHAPFLPPMDAGADMSV